MNDDYIEVLVPSLGVNDEKAKLVEWNYKEGVSVEKGSFICVMETTKTTFEVEAGDNGYLVPLVAENEEISVGQVCALIVASKSKLEESKTNFHNRAKQAETSNIRATKKAVALAKKYSVDLADLAESVNGLIREKDVIRLFEGKVESRIQCSARSPLVRENNGRVLIVGAGRGVNQVLSVLLHEEGTQVIGLLDDADDLQDKAIKEIKVLGRLNNFEEICEQHQVDSVVCAVSKSISFRKKVFDVARKFGVRLANVIHDTAVIDDNVTIGEGNYIGANCYFGDSASIGNYCFISSANVFEHHNFLGDGITTGPNVVTSGSVTIGNHVKFGMGINIEPRVIVGDNALISTGACIIQNVAADTIVTKSYTQQTKSK